MFLSIYKPKVVDLNPKDKNVSLRIREAQDPPRLWMNLLFDSIKELAEFRDSITLELAKNSHEFKPEEAKRECSYNHETLRKYWDRNTCPGCGTILKEAHRSDPK